VSTSRGGGKPGGNRAEQCSGAGHESKKYCRPSGARKILSSRFNFGIYASRRIRLRQTGARQYEANEVGAILGPDTIVSARREKDSACFGAIVFDLSGVDRGFGSEQAINLISEDVLTTH